MKKKICSLALLFALNTTVCGLSAETKQITSDVIIDAPPADSTYSPIPASPSKSKRGNPNSTSGRRAGAAPEVKAFSFANRAFGPERFAKAVIVRSGKADPRITAQLQEDLAVMSRILEKSAAEYKDEHEEAAGIQIFTLQGGRPIRSMYLEEYGVVFTLNVSIPLKPEPKIEEVEDKRQDNANEEWNDARNELFGEKRAWRGHPDKPPRRSFDPHQVEEFRNSLVDALKNASNIRHLRETDFVTIVVRGRSLEGDIENRLELLMENGGRVLSPVAEERSGDSTLVLRIRKNELDDAVKRKGPAEEFKKKVSITAY